MRLHATKEEVAQVRARIEEFGYKVHSIEGEERVVIGAVGMGDVTACLESLEAMPQVEKAVRISAPYKFVSKEFRPEKTEITVAGATIGGDEFVVMAGPCSVESEKQILESAEIVAKHGAKLLRGGAFKPRTSPYDFQGLEEEGLKLLAKARKLTGLGIITEVMSDRDVSSGGRVRRHSADRRAQHAELRAAQDARQVRPSDSAEARPERHGQRAADVGRIHRRARQPQVMLCERGIRTFETVTRNTCDIGAIAALNELTHLPVILDPSHAAGKRSLVPALARAGVAVGADGLDRRNAPAAGKGGERRCAIARSQAVRQDDGRSEALHRAVEAGAHGGDRRGRLNDTCK